MTILTIQLPDDVIERLNAKAAARHQRLDLYMSDVLIQDAGRLTDLAAEAALLEVVQQIRALPPRAAEFIQPAVGSLKNALAKQMESNDPNFDEKTWDEHWQQVEAEMKAADKRDHIEDQIRDL